MERETRYDKYSINVQGKRASVLGGRMSPTAAASAVAYQAEQLRQDGNLYFKKGKLDAAIDAYTEAIALCSNVAVCWTNRALCHGMINHWDKVELDCRKAIQLDHNSLKAHYLLGLALLKKAKYSEAIIELEKALDLGRDANPNGDTVEEIRREFAKAKFLEWEQESSRRSWELQTLKANCEIALREKHLIDASQTKGFNHDPDMSVGKQLDTLEWVLKKAALDDIPTEVPEYLCCNITLDIFPDPVITPSGITYERSTILAHLQKVGKFDPVTHEPLAQSQLIPNLAMKEAVRAFLATHGWAYRRD